MQAEGNSSDCVLKPVAVYPDATRKNGVLVMCEVMMPDGKTPHSVNARATILDDPDAWFGFEQEYFLYKDGRPLGFPRRRLSGSAGPVLHRCRLQERRLTSPARSSKSTSTCASTPASTTKASTPKWRRASGNSRSSAKARKTAADQMWMARYLMMRLCEKYGVDIELHCKPLGDADWNGSGMHCNFSTKYMREVGGKEYFETLMAAFDKYRNEHIAVYGPDNHLRLTGLHETQSIDKFNYGVANRGASIRVPHSFVNNGYKGYLEDRRPNSQGDPYQIASHSEDHCHRADRRQGRGLRSSRTGLLSARDENPIRQSVTALADLFVCREPAAPPPCTRACHRIPTRYKHPSSASGELVTALELKRGG